MKRLYLTIISTYFFLGPVVSIAQEFQTVRLNQYTQNNGLSSNYVTKLHQDQYGFLWVGTQEGLNSFDGKSFETFSSQAVKNRNIGGALVQDLAEDVNRSILWVATAYGELSAIDLTTHTIIQQITTGPDGTPLSEQWVRSIELVNDILWIGGLNILLAYDVEKKAFLDVRKIEQSIKVKGEYNFSIITSDDFGNTWLLNEGSGIEVIDSKLSISHSIKLDEIAGNPQKKLIFWDASYKSGQMYVASSWGLIHFKLNQDATPKLLKDIPDILDDNEVRSVELPSDSMLFVATTRHIYKVQVGSKTAVRMRDEDPENNGFGSVFQIYYDSDSDLVWIGTQSGLSSFNLSKGPFTPYTQKGAIKMKNLYSLLPISNTEVYAGAENGIFYIDGNNQHIALVDSSSTNLLLFRDANQNIFASNSQGFKLIEGQSVRPASDVMPELKKLNQDFFNAALQYNDSIILLASVIQKGLTVWNTHAKSIITYHGDSANYKIPDLRVINYLYQGKNGDVFILTEKSIISFDPLTGKATTHVVNDGSQKRVGNFMDMGETEDSYFLATYGDGLIETDKAFKVKNVYTTKDGLSNNCIYRIFPLSNHTLLGTSNNGLSVIRLDSISSVDTYFYGDGLHGNGFEQLCGYQLDELIYAGGPDGFSVVNTRLLGLKTEHPRLYLKNVKIVTNEDVLDTSNLFLPKITIPNHALQTTINFAALNFKNPERTTYQYKIEELGNEWIDIGNQRFVDLLGLAPGTYTLQLKAYNETNNASLPVTLLLHFLPKWHQTPWFRGSILATLIAIVFLLQRYRIFQIRKQQQIRREIANDLHDDIGSTLNSLKIFTHLAQFEPENKDHLSQIEDSITNATVGLRDMLWVLDDTQDSAYELIERIKKFALPICQANGINFKTEINVLTEKSITKNVKRNLLLIAKESINNSIKYASCDNINVSFIQTRREMSLIISDNGVGFDMSQVSPERGLENIEYRSKQINFNCKVSSDDGTRIEISNV